MNEIEFDELNGKMQRYVRWFQSRGCDLKMCFDDGAGYQSAQLWMQYDNVILLEYQQGKITVIIDE